MSIVSEIKATSRRYNYDINREVMETASNLVKTILEISLERGLLDTLRDICEGENGNGYLGGPQALENYNTFPFGTPTNNVYPRFVGICQGSMRLNTVLNEAKKHCQRLEKSGIDFESSVVEIITDKWDPKTFQKYEMFFLQQMLLRGTEFYFYLATDYGMTIIPFISKYKIHELIKKYRDKGIVLVENGWNKSKKLDVDIFSYEIQQAHSGRGYRKWEKYWFDAKHKIWHYENFEGIIRSGRIPDDALMLFLMNAIPILDEYRKKVKSDSKKQDVYITPAMLYAAHDILRIGDNEVDFTNPFNMNLNGELRIVNYALHEFIDECLKREE